MEVEEVEAQAEVIVMPRRRRPDARPAVTAPPWTDAPYEEWPLEWREWFDALPADRRLKRRMPPPCRACGGPRKAYTRSRVYCEEHEHLAKRRTPLGCVTCGQPKPPGRGRYYCAECEPSSPRRVYRPDGSSKRLPRPCPRCGDLALRESGHRLCPDCEAVEHEASVARRNAKRARERKLCAGCFKPKGAVGRGIYCQSCKRARKNAVRPCPGPGGTGCGAPITERYAKRCTVCRLKGERIAAERRSALHAERMRTSPEYRAKRAATLAASHERRKAPLARAHPSKLPARPLALALRAYIAREERGGNVWDLLPMSHNDGRAETICKRFGLSEKSLRDWESGRRAMVQLGTADAVLVAIGLGWWDVWTDGPDAERARLVFEGRPKRRQPVRVKVDLKVDRYDREARAQRAESMPRQGGGRFAKVA